MKIDGVTPGQGNQADRTAAKKPVSAPGKSFADILKKAAQGPAGAPQANPAAPPGPANDAPPPSDHDLGTIKHRLQTGYYNNPKVDDALSDRLSGYFDDLA